MDTYQLSAKHGGCTYANESFATVISSAEKRPYHSSLPSYALVKRVLPPRKYHSPRGILWLERIPMDFNITKFPQGRESGTSLNPVDSHSSYLMNMIPNSGCCSNNRSSRSKSFTQLYSPTATLVDVTPFELLVLNTMMTTKKVLQYLQWKQCSCQILYWYHKAMR